MEWLKPWRGNPRLSDDTVRALVDEIRQLGWGSPLVVRGDGTIVCGHTRWRAAKHLVSTWREGVAGWHEDAERVGRTGTVPARIRADLTDEQAQDLALADNRIGESSRWDDAALEALLENMTPDRLRYVGFADRVRAEAAAEEESAAAAAAESAVEEVDVSSMDPTFWVDVRGPLPAEPAVLDALRDALSAMPNVKVTMGMVG